MSVPMPLPANPLFPSPRSLQALLRGTPRASAPMDVRKSAIIASLRSGAIKIRLWTDLADLFGTEAGVGLDVLPWLIAYTAPTATVSPSAARDWSSLFHQVLPAPSTARSPLRERSSSRAQLLTAAALEFHLPLPAASFFCPVKGAAYIFSLCILPVPHAPKFITPDQIPAVRQWLLDSLMLVDSPYGQDAELSTRRWNFLMEGPQELPQGASLRFPHPPRHELSLALDNLTAAWLKIGSRLGPGLLSSIESATEFVERLSCWPEASAALMRTDASRIAPYADVVEPKSCTDLICACASVSTLAALAQPMSPIAHQSWADWFAHPADDRGGPGDIAIALSASAGSSGFLSLVEALAHQFGCTPLAGASGKILAHVLLAAHPTLKSTRTLLDLLGPASFTVQDHAGLTPIGSIVEKMKTKRQKDGSIFWGPMVAMMEQMVLRAAQDIPLPADAESELAVLTRPRRL